MPIELDYKPGMCTLMGGRQLEHFSNRVYEAAAHRVVSYGPGQLKLGESPPSKTKELKESLQRFKQNPKSTAKAIFKKFRNNSSHSKAESTIPNRTVRKESKEGNPYRYSIVFVLRADSDVPMNYASLSSKVCGDVTYRDTDPSTPKTAGELFDRIRKAHFNVNTYVDEREKQKQELAQKKDKHTQAADHTLANQHPLITADEDFEPPPHPPPGR
jgi:hypothetical protein